MKKCLRCGTEMDDGYELLVASFFSNIATVKIRDTSKDFTFKNCDEIKVMVCPNCGEVSLNNQKDKSKK